MANKLYEESAVQAIANAIRTKTGSTGTYYTIAQMAQGVLDIPTGGGSGGGGTDTSDATLTNGSYLLIPYSAYGPTGKINGSMANRSTTTQHTAGGADTQGSGLRFYIPNNGYYTTSNRIFRSNADVASDIGLTAAKIVSGNTILGIPGTGGSGSGGSQTIGGNTFTCGAWTQVSDDNSSVTITHDLGISPSSISIWATPSAGAAGGIVSIVYLETFGMTGISFFNAYNSGVEADAGSFIYVDSTDFVFTPPSDTVLPSGWTYCWVAF